MSTLGIFTVKKLVRHDGQYWTYGGFGDYLATIRTYFDRVVLFAHVREGAPPVGHYLIPCDGLEVVELPWYTSELGALLALPRMMATAIRHVRQLDVIHARLPDYTGVVGALAGRWAGIPVFHQIVADWSIEADQTPVTKRGGLGLLLKLHLRLYDWFERRVCRRGLVFAQGDSAYEKHAPTADAHLVASAAHHAADVVAASAATPRFARAPYRIINVARLTGVKNQALILRALRELNRDGPAWRLTLVGSGARDADLRREAATLGVSAWVEFAGAVGRGAPLWRHYDAADVFVLSSRAEGTPKVVLEAMARAVPVVATRVAGVPTLVTDDVSGVLFPDNDVDALVAALRSLATDPDRVRRLIAAGRETALHRTVEAETERMMRIVAGRWPSLQIATVPERATHLRARVRRGR